MVLSLALEEFVHVMFVTASTNYNISIHMKNCSCYNILMECVVLHQVYVKRSTQTHTHTHSAALSICNISYHSCNVYQRLFADKVNYSILVVWLPSARRCAHWWKMLVNDVLSSHDKYRTVFRCENWWHISVKLHIECR